MLMIEAFGALGDNAQAHDLAIGLFVSWFPILILCSIVDRNPVASDDIQRKLNKLVDLVCTSLQDPDIRGDFLDSFHNSSPAEMARMEFWVNKIAYKAPLIKHQFFNGFAGQGRVRFHYGAAHAILMDIEKSYIAGQGRGWLSQDARAARAQLVLGQVDHGFVWFDGRQLWQISTSAMLVIGTSAGAFILSYFTPTVGLGCRSGGYVIFITIATFLLLAELIVWMLTSPIRNNQLSFLVKQQTRALNSTEDELSKIKNISFPGLAKSKATLSRVINLVETAIVAIVLPVAKIFGLGKRVDRVESAIRLHFRGLHGLTTRQWVERSLFTPIEFINMVWLAYLMMAQTLGAFVNCECQTSNVSASPISKTLKIVS